MDSYDREVIKKINNYILEYNISIKKLANAANIPYHRLWTILNQSYSIKLSDYVGICKAFNEPVTKFL